MQQPVTSDAGAEAKAVFERSLKPKDATDYEAEKDQLLDEERKHESSWQEATRSNPLKTSDGQDVETRAAAIIFKIREEERVDPKLFGNLPGEDVPDKETRDMGGRFLKNRANIDQSKLFRIACELPKGAHLHLHFNSELRPEYLFPHASKRPDTFFIRATRALRQQEDFDETEIVFNVLDKTKIVTADIFSSDYKPDVKRPESGTWMLWKDFRLRFPDHYPRGPSGNGFIPEHGIGKHHLMPPDRRPLDEAERWAREKMIITQDLKYNVACTHNDMWARFNRGTRAFKGLLNYEGIYRDYIGNAIDHMILDGVMYAELRPMLMDKTIPSDDGKSNLNHQDQMNIVLEEVLKKKKKLQSKGELEKFPYGLKIIYCTPRSIPRARMQTELEDCIKLALQFKNENLICGFDLVGAEDRPNNIGFYADQLRAFQRACKELDLDIPFMFHAGETLLDTGGSNDPEKSNLYDAWLLSAKRIGHGYSILKHPMLVEKYRPRREGKATDRKAIALELCPISNELLGLCGNAREHPFPALLAAGLHCTLNADNPSLFRGTNLNSSSLSHEFYQVMVGDTRMTLFGWRQLAEWSIEHSCLSEKQKAEAVKILRRRWIVFCQWVIDSDTTGFENLTTN